MQGARYETDTCPPADNDLSVERENRDNFSDYKSSGEYFPLVPLDPPPPSSSVHRQVDDRRIQEN